MDEKIKETTPEVAGETIEEPRINKKATRAFGESLINKGRHNRKNKKRK